MNSLSKLRGSIQDLVYYLRQQDRDATRQWLFKVLRTVARSRIEYSVVAYPLDQALPTFFEAHLPVTYRAAKQEDLSSLQGAVPPSELERFSKRLACGRLCTLALYHDNIAAYGWATDKIEFETDNLEFLLEPGDVYMDDVYTLPVYRRQGIQMALVLQQLRYLQEHGFKRAIGIIAEDNIPSQRLFARIGVKQVGHLSFRRILLKRDYRYHRVQF